MIEVLEDVHRIKHREEGGFLFQIFDEQLQRTLSKLGEKLHVGFVPICQDQLYIKTNGS